MKTKGEVLALFRVKYEYLKSVYPVVGPFDESNLYQTPDGGWQMNFANCAAITLSPKSNVPHETHGAICEKWYSIGGAFNEKGERGELGFPISDETSIIEREMEFISGGFSDTLDVAYDNGTLCEQDYDDVSRESDRQNDDFDQLKSQGIDLWEISRDAPLGRVPYKITRKWRKSRFQRGVIRWRDIPSGMGHIEIDYKKSDYQKYIPVAASQPPPSIISQIGAAVKSFGELLREWVLGDAGSSGSQDEYDDNDEGNLDWEEEIPVGCPCALYAVHAGLTVCAENGGGSPLVANRQSPQGAWEEFTLFQNNDGSYSLKSHANGLFVSARPDGRLIAAGAKVDAWELFDLEKVSGKSDVFTLWSRNTRKYVSVDESEGNVLIANRESADTWEEFRIVRVER